MRSTDPSFQSAVDERLTREVESRGLEVLDLVGLDRAEWLDRVECVVKDRLRPEQLELI